MVPICVIAPEGTVVNPVLPAACGARGVIGYRVYDAIMRALAQIVPERVVAAGEGGPTLVALGGYDEAPTAVPHDGGNRRRLGRARDARRARGRLQSRLPTSRTNRSSCSRASFRSRSCSTASSPTPAAPVSAAAGSPTSASTACRTERATLTIRSDRRFHPPYGLAGGLPGAPSRNTLIVDGTERDVPPMPMDGAVPRTRRPLPPPLRGRRRLWLAVCPRSAGGAGGRARREGQRRGGARAVRGRPSTGRRGAWTRRRPAPCGSVRDDRRRDPERPRRRRVGSPRRSSPTSGSPATGSSRSARRPRRPWRSTPPGSTSPRASSTSTATPTTRCSSTRGRSARSTRASRPRSSATAGTGASRSATRSSRSARSTGTRRRSRSRGATRRATSSGSRRRGRR